MHRLNTLNSLIFLFVLSACAAVKPPSNALEGDTETRSAKPAPELLKTIPTEVGSFEYDGYRYFDDDSTGYAFRYINEGKHRMADVYVYPVAESNERLDHEELVMGSTRATIAAISDAVNQGLYSNFNVVGAATRASGFRTVARVEATYLRQNLASYTLVYQTEYDGTLLKIRVSMPDNEMNRESVEWDDFAETMFGNLVNELDDIRKRDTQS